MVWDEDDDEEFVRTQTLEGGVMLRVTVTSLLSFILSSHGWTLVM